MMIDLSAIKSLEIMQNRHNPKPKECLFGLLNNTTTAMGSRMLRSNILQPPTRHDTFIQPRYDALEEMATSEEIFRSTQQGTPVFVADLYFEACADHPQNGNSVDAVQ